MATISQTYTFVAGAIPTAAQWNSNWTTVVNAINGNLDADNVDTTVVATLATANAWTADQTFNDSVKVTLGSSGDADLYYDGTDVILNTAVAGTGDFVVTGGSIEFDDSEGVTLGTGKDATIQYDGTNLVINPKAVGSGIVDVDGDVQALTVTADGDTSAGDNATMGYTATEGLILTGQGSTNDVTIKNDADTAVISIPTGATGVTFAGVTTHGGNVVSDTDSTDDLGTTGVRWANLYVDDITTTTSAIVNTMTLATGSITDSSGAISFGNENLTTTGTLSAGATTVTSLLASSNDVGAIGASGTAFSDLFLASGAVVNFNAGDVTITHASNSLAIEGGNVAVGATPDAWGSGWTGFQVADMFGMMGQTAGGASNLGSLVMNTYYDGTNWKYIQTDEASRISQTDGIVQFHTTAAGTAGNNITWTETMRIDNAGVIGVGTASGGSRTGMVGTVKFDVAHANAKATADAEQQVAFFGSSDAANPLGLSVGFRSNATGGSRYVTLDASEVGLSNRPMYLQSISGGDVVMCPTVGAVFIGDTANANMTVGLTINQGANDDEIFALKSSDVGHEMTSLAQDDTYFTVTKREATSGGAYLTGYKDADGTAFGAMAIRGVLGENVDTTKTASGLGIVNIEAGITNGAGNWQLTNADGNLLTVQNFNSTRFIVDEDGDLFADGGTSSTNMVTQYDEFEDAQLIRAFSTMGNAQNVIKDKWDNFVQYNEDTLVDLGILGAPLKDKPLYNVTKLQKLQNGAIWQLYTQIMDMAERIEENVPALRGKLLPEVV